MKTKIFIGLDENDLLTIEQITIDQDAKGALTFIEEIVKKRIDRERGAKMKRQNI